MITLGDHDPLHYAHILALDNSPGFENPYSRVYNKTDFDTEVEH
jgi:hypothetical protein